MNKADKAESLFRTGYNCSQSVYAAFAEELGITVEEAAKKASPFGAGFGKLREVCGAVTGMVMVIGDLYGYDDPKDAAGKKQLYVLVQKLCGSLSFGRKPDLPGTSRLEKAKIWKSLRSERKRIIRADLV